MPVIAAWLTSNNTGYFMSDVHANFPGGWKWKHKNERSDLNITQLTDFNSKNYQIRN